MKKIWMALFVILLACTSGCAQDDNEKQVNLKQEFELKLDQTARLKGEDLKIWLVDIGEDSRCPKNVVCVWEGEVICTVEINSTGKTEQKPLIKSGLTVEWSETSYGDYRIYYDVQPYPEAGKNVSKSDYYLRLRIEK